MGSFVRLPTRCGFLLATLLGCSLALAGAQELHLKRATFDPIVAVPELPQDLRLAGEPDSGYFLVQFRGRIEPPLLDELASAGATPLQYVPDRGYLVRLSGGRATAVRALPDVRWLGAFQPGWKIAPDLGTRPFADPTRREGGSLYAVIDLFPGENLDATAELAAANGLDVLQKIRFGKTRRLKVRGTLDQLRQTARLSSVAWIEELGEITLRNNTARWVVQTDVVGSTTIWDHGLHGESQIIGHIDGRLDINSCYFEDPTDNTPGPSHRKVIAYRSSSGIGSSSHGTHTAGTAAGDASPLSGSISGNGHAYAAKISHTNLGDISGSGSQPSNLYEALEDAHQDGARVHTNSWGDDGTTSYTTWCQDIDQFSYDFEDSLVLFASTNLGSLRSPENAKNVLAVGGSQNGTGADTFCTGGAGPTNDGRRKPEIFAPGCSIVSARNNSSCSTTSSSGTSMACPAVTGAGALVRQYFEEGWYPSGTPQPADSLSPSGALVKATLLNASVDMANVGGFPSNQEGWGRLLLENGLFFDGDLRRVAILADVRNVDGLTTGETISYPLVVDGSAEPLKLTLVFTEPAAALFANPATVNNLDLEAVSPSGQLYKGNVFAGGSSTTGGAADAINNVEMVLVPSPESGEWSVRIHGTAVNQGTQGYAVVTTGQASGGGGELRFSSRSVQDDPPLGNGNGLAEPGETITLPVELRNLLGVPATSVSTRLRAEGAAVQITDESAAYPDIGVNATETSLVPHHRFTVPPDTPCGTSIPFDLDIAHDGGSTQASFTIPVGLSHLDFAADDLPDPLPAPSAVSATIQIDDPITIGDINVALRISHPNIGALVVRLTSPQGTSVFLHNRTDIGTADIDTVYDSQELPDGPGSLSDLDGQPAQGLWTLLVQNAAGAGNLESWTLMIDPEGESLCTPLDCGDDPVPPEVSTSLMVQIENDQDLRFSWAAVPDAAGYRVWRSTASDFYGETFVGETATTSYLLEGGLVENPSFYYRVRAINSCEWEGP